MSIIKRISRAFRIVLQASVLLIILLYLVNWSDGERPAGLDAYLHYDSLAGNAADNGYYAFIGIYAPENENPVEWGIALAQDMNRLTRSKLAHIGSDRDTEKYSTKINNPGWLDLSLNTPKSKSDRKRRRRGESGYTNLFVCSDGSCLSHYRQHRTFIERRLREPRVRLALQRLHDVYEYSHFRDDVIPSLLYGSLPNYGGQAILAERARISLLAIDGKTSLALDALAKNSDLWRLVLRNSKTIVGRSVSVSFLMKNNELLAEIIRSNRLNAGDWRRVTYVLRPLAPGSLDWRDAYREDFLNTYNDLFASPNMIFKWDVRLDNRDRNWYWNNFLTRPLYQHNDTLAYLFDNALIIDELVQLPGKKLKSTLETEHQKSDQMAFGLHWIRNPVGKYLFNGLRNNHVTGRSGYLTYIVKAHNLDLQLILLRQMQKIRQSGIQIGDIEKLTASMSPNPISGDPLQWDRATKSLVTKGFRKSYKSNEIFGESISIGVY